MFNRRPPARESLYGNGAGAACFPFPLPQTIVANKKRKSTFNFWFLRAGFSEIVISVATIVMSRVHAATLETCGANRKGKGRFGLAFFQLLAAANNLPAPLDVGSEG
jgi:hypothetical protein